MDVCPNSAFLNSIESIHTEISLTELVMWLVLSYPYTWTPNVKALSTWEYEYTGYYLLSISETLCLSDGVKNHSLNGVWWCGIVRVLISTLSFKFIINSFDKSMLEDDSIFGDWSIWPEILTVFWVWINIRCWVDRHGRWQCVRWQPKNEFDYWNHK